MSIYNCPHCGEKSFNPLTKAFLGQLNSYGKPCKKCGKKVVNGEGATIFNAVFSLICFILIVITYLKAPSTAGTSLEWIDQFELLIVMGLIILKLIVPKLVNAFFFKLKPAIKINLP